LAPGFDPDRLWREEQPEHLPEDQLLDNKCYRYGKDQPCDYCHECDYLLHMNSPLRGFHARSIEWQFGHRKHVVEKTGSIEG
jgi:hypothetical protein